MHKDRKNPFLAYALVVSLLLHLSVLVFRPGHRDRDSLPAAPPPIEITEVRPEWLEAQPTPPAEEQLPEQIAETEAADSAEEDPDTRFWSDRTQTVKEQTRAKMVDDFRAKQGTGLKGKAEQRAQVPPPTGENEADKGGSEADASRLAVDAPESEKTAGVKRDWQNLTLQDLGIGGNGLPTAASDDALKDIAAGERTLLSTREFQYFSYYQRIKELLRQHWKPTIQQKLSKMWGKGKNVRADEFTTKVMILLDRRGDLQRVTRVASSGIQEFDTAAVEAFHKAGPFPNPPAGIVDADGFVRIHWDFILTIESAPTIQFQNVGRMPP